MRNQRSLDSIFWAGQWILAIAFEVTGLVKLGLGAHLSGRIGFAAGLTTGLLQAAGTIEVLLSLLVILPALTRLLPQVSTAAAASVAAIAALGIASPETALGSGATAVNVTLVALGAFVVWGRVAIAPFERDRAVADDPVLASPRAIEHAASYP